MANSRGAQSLAALVVVAGLAAPIGGSALARTVPQVTIDDGPKKQTKKRVAKFAFSSDDPAATFECRIDDPGFEPCASPFVLTRLDRGRHVFEVRAVDVAGTVSTPAVQKWKVLKRGAVSRG